MARFVALLPITTASLSAGRDTGANPTTGAPIRLEHADVAVAALRVCRAVARGDTRAKSTARKTERPVRADERVGTVHVFAARFVTRRRLRT